MLLLLGTSNHIYRIVVARVPLYEVAKPNLLTWMVVDCDLTREVFPLFHISFAMLFMVHASWYSSFATFFFAEMVHAGVLTPETDKALA